MTTLIKLFEEKADLTQEKLEALKQRVEGLVFDLSTKDGFAAAKETRKECKTILEKIDRAAIDYKNEVDAARKGLKKNVEEIYTSTTTPLEEEESRRKAEKKKKEDEKKAAEQAIREQIDGIRVFAQNVYTMSSQEVQDTIEAISTIDITQFGKLQDEADRAKKETISILGSALPLIIKSESAPKPQPVAEQPAPAEKTIWEELADFCDQVGMSLKDSEKLETIIKKYID